MLANRAARSQTGKTMNTLSRTALSKIVVGLVLAGLTILTIRAFAQGSNPRPNPSDRKLTLKIKDAELKDDTGATFKRVMGALKGDQYSVRIKHKDGKSEEIVPSSGASIKLDKVIKSELATGSDLEFTAIGIHVTQTVVADTAEELGRVLEALK